VVLEGIMDASFTRTGPPPIRYTPHRDTLARRLWRRLSAVAIVAAEKVTLPYRNAPAESYRFPWF
jgi:hypothetical protein